MVLSIVISVRIVIPFCQPRLDGAVTPHVYYAGALRIVCHFEFIVVLFD